MFFSGTEGSRIAKSIESNETTYLPITDFCNQRVCQ